MQFLFNQKQKKDYEKDLDKRAERVGISADHMRSALSAR